MSRFAKSRSVFFFEEPEYYEGEPTLNISPRNDGLRVVTPYLPTDYPTQLQEEVLQQLLEQFLANTTITDFVAWYYTPMAVTWTQHLRPSVIIYDCMDELSLFRHAPPVLVDREEQLLHIADLVFTGGASLHEAKQKRRSDVHLFPSSIDVAHFYPARTPKSDPSDQQGIPHPRLGFFGVIDERMDTQLLEDIATVRPDWHIVMIGPVVKIDPHQLPRRANIHYLGQKSYAELPAYIAGWDIALMPFALNESTRFISPTKTPEYMAAGRPIVSTPIRDVVRPYGEAELVHIADTPERFIESIEMILAETPEARKSWLYRVDGFLSTTSWDRTWHNMARLIAETRSSNKSRQIDTSSTHSHHIHDAETLGATPSV
jgi:UDP-galactopyranose mutase